MLQFSRSCILIIAICVLACSIKAQSYRVVLQSVDSSSALLQKELSVPASFSEGSGAFSFVSRIVPSLQEKGYLAASIDSMGITGEQYDVFVFLGNRYRWTSLSLDSIPPGIRSQAGISTSQWSSAPLNPRQLSRLTSRLLEWNENNGFPFAKVWLDQVSVDRQGGVTGFLRLDPGGLRKIDSVIVEGNVKVSREFMLRYLDIEEGSPYNEKKLRGITPRLQELSFLQPAAPWAVEFRLTDTRLDLYLKEKKANQLNAIIGLLPNSVETGKFLLTVDALFAFQNILSRGESISLSYQNLQYRSPRLKADLVWPYLFNTAFGADVHFDLFKKDTTFRRTTLQAGVRYQLNPTDYLRVFYQNQSNRLITVDTQFVRSRKQLPDNVDVSANGGGLELGVNRTDYRLNPRRGWELTLSGSALLRQVKESDAITGLTDGSGFSYASLYDSLQDRSYQYFLQGSAAYYHPLAKKLVVKAAYNGAWVTGKSLFRNELYQIGGFKLLRGFDEQSIFADQYHILSLELRLLLDQNSYLTLFSDNGYVSSRFNGSSTEGLYNGFGIGTVLETKSGLFSLSYALGRSENHPVQFRQSRIHFGYIAFF
jgi:outer membrane protein assembly factor BamA